ncbi:MAG: serine O-acetyltransferase [Pseudomonadota bacterium]
MYTDEAERARHKGTPVPITLFRQVLEDADCVFKRDPAARNRLEVLTTYPGVHAIIWHRLAHRLWRNGLTYPARFVAYLTRLLTNIDIHPGATIGRRFFIDHGAGVVIGETAIIGDDVTLYHGVTLGGTTWNRGRRHPTLGNGVMVGAGAKVLGAITLGENVRVGANSVVVRDVPAGRSVVGIPGRIVREEGERNGSASAIDLDHHLIPDPVGKAIGCLMQRIEYLESRLEDKAIDEGCVSCGEERLCQPEGFDSYGNPRRRVTMRSV